jgi:hypothetical protein
MAKFASVKNALTEEQEETKNGMWNLIDEFKRGRELGPTAVTSGNLCEESASSSNRHIKKKPKILDFFVFEKEFAASRSQEDEIEKYVNINASHVEINDFTWLVEKPRRGIEIPVWNCQAHTLFTVNGASTACSAGASHRPRSERVLCILFLHSNTQQKAMKGYRVPLVISGFI